MCSAGGVPGPGLRNTDLTSRKDLNTSLIKLIFISQAVTQAALPAAVKQLLPLVFFQTCLTQKESRFLPCSSCTLTYFLENAAVRPQFDIGSIFSNGPFGSPQISAKNIQI